MGDYSRQEVQLLLSIDVDDARKSDQQDAHLGYDEVPLVVRWHDVREAKRRVVTEKRDQEVVRLRAEGLTEEEVAERLGVDRSTVNRRFRASLDEIIAALGGEQVIGKISRPERCLRCGERPRARAIAVRRNVEGLWRPVGERVTHAAPTQPVPGEEYPLSFCAACVPPAVRERVVLRRVDIDRMHKTAT